MQMSVHLSKEAAAAAQLRSAAYCTVSKYLS